MTEIINTEIILKLNNFPQRSEYIKKYDGETKWMYFLTKYDGLLKT